MPKGVGKALERAISTKDDHPSDDAGKRDVRFEFLNENRRQIFQFLCSHPASNPSMISRAVGLSLHSVNWHLRRLVDTDFISKETIGKKIVYFPKEMISKEDLQIFELLNNKRARDIYCAISDHNGLYQAEICEILGLKHQAVIWYTKKMESLGLISTLEDGKFRRYYPTGLLGEKKVENEKRIKVFCQLLIKRLEKENLAPSVIRWSQDKFVVKIQHGLSKAVLTLAIDPFVTVLS